MNKEEFLNSISDTKLYVNGKFNEIIEKLNKLHISYFINGHQNPSEYPFMYISLKTSEEYCDLEILSDNNMNYFKESKKQEIYPNNILDSNINEFKDGDILVTYEAIFIYKKIDDGYGYYCAKFFDDSKLIIHGINSYSDTECWTHDNVRFANNIEKESFINHINKKGYYWNKNINELIELPKLHQIINSSHGICIYEGIHNDEILSSCTHSILDIFKIDYGCELEFGSIYGFRDATPYEKKCIISELNKKGYCYSEEFGICASQAIEFKPFDKVIVRNSFKEWTPNFFWKKADDGKFIVISGEKYELCMPFENYE
jgi:hypothetical protein